MTRSELKASREREEELESYVNKRTNELESEAARYGYKIIPKDSKDIRSGSKTDYSGKSYSNKRSKSTDWFDVWFRLGLFAAFYIPAFVTIMSKEEDWTDKMILMVVMLSGTVLLVIEHEN